MVKMGRVQLLLIGLVCFASAIAAADPLLRQQHEQELLGAKVSIMHSAGPWRCGMLLICRSSFRPTQGKPFGSG